MKVELSRTDICNLIMSCTAADTLSSLDTIKWKRLHDHLKDILNQYDENPSNKIIYRYDDNDVTE